MKLRRASALVVAVVAVLALTSAPNAEACMRCQMFLGCSVDECWFYEFCVYPQNLQGSRAECWSDMFSCFTNGQHCLWT